MEWGWRYGTGLALRNGSNPHNQQKAMITQHFDYVQPLIANSCEQVIDRKIS
jgi:hypothetical protein